MFGRRADRAGDPTIAGRPRRWGPRWRTMAGAGVLFLLSGVGYEAVSLYYYRPLDPHQVVRQTLELAQQAEGLSARSAQTQAQILELKEQALGVAKSLVEQYPASPDAWCVLGLVASRCGNRSGAVRCWQRALALAPQFSLAWHCLGRDALQRADYAQAIEQLRKALAAEPDVPEVLLALADALSHADQLHQALEVCKRHVVVAPQSVEGWYRLGRIYIQLGEFGEAKRCLARAVELDPDCKLALHSLALACERLGQLEEARRYRRAFAEREAQDRAPGENRRPKYDDLAATREVVATTCSAAARVYEAMGAPEAAEGCWRQGAEASPKSVEARRGLLAFYEQRDRVEDALRVAEELCALEPQSLDHHLKAGWLNVRVGRLEKAEQAFRRATEVAPSRPEGFVGLAQLYLHQDRSVARAKEAAARAVSLSPIAANYFLLGTACRRSGDLQGARTALQQAARLDPGKPEYREALASVLVQMRLVPPLEEARP